MTYFLFNRHASSAENVFSMLTAALDVFNFPELVGSENFEVWGGVATAKYESDIATKPFRTELGDFFFVFVRHWF